MRFIVSPSRPQGFPTDVCVPISRLVDCVMASQEDVRAAGAWGGVPVSSLVSYWYTWQVRHPV